MYLITWYNFPRLNRSNGTRPPPYELSVCCRGLYLTTHNSHTRQTSMPPAGFEPAIPANKGLQTHASGHVTTAIGTCYNSYLKC